MELPFRVTICGLDELPGCSALDVSHVLSILDPGWPVPAAFGAFRRHERLELRFHDVIDEEPGSVVPQSAHVEQFLAFGRALGADQVDRPHILVHCHAGISRSSASLAVLLAQAVPGCSAAAIFAEIMRLRPCIWPNLRIVELGDALLGRNGDLIAAAHGVYRLQVYRRPEIADQMRAGGRAREVVSEGAAAH